MPFFQRSSVPERVMLIPSINTLPATALRSPASTSARTC